MAGMGYFLGILRTSVRASGPTGTMRKAARPTTAHSRPFLSHAKEFFLLASEAGYPLFLTRTKRATPPLSCERCKLPAFPCPVVAEKSGTQPQATARAIIINKIMVQSARPEHFNIKGPRRTTGPRWECPAYHEEHGPAGLVKPRLSTRSFAGGHAGICVVLCSSATHVFSCTSPTPFSDCAYVTVTRDLSILTCFPHPSPSSGPFPGAPTRPESTICTNAWSSRQAVGTCPYRRPHATAPKRGMCSSCTRSGKLTCTVCVS